MIIINKPITDHLGNKFTSQKEMCEYWNINLNTFYSRHITKKWSLKDTLEKPKGHNPKNYKTDHLGNTFTSIEEMCKHHNITISMYENRKSKGLPLDQILMPRKRIPGHTDHLGNTFTSVKEMCEFHNITISMYENRKSKGLPLDQILKPSNRQSEYIDHLGNKFKTIKEMCQYWNIPYHTFNIRYNKQQWSLRKSLETPVTTNNITDHLGNKFKTIKEMCQYWNISKDTFNKRYNKNKWSLKDTLETKNIITDHKNNQFKNIKEMCSYWNISYSVFRERYMIKKWLLKDALETPTTITDHLGNIFNSKKEMCSYWNISYSVFRERYMVEKWSLKDALETPLKCESTKTIDHLGNEFENITTMCKYWNIPYHIFYERHDKLHWSLKDALESPIGHNPKNVAIDHLGNKFKSIKAMCEHWNISVDTFYSRYHKLNWSLQDALETPHKYNNNTITDHLGHKFKTLTEMCNYWNISSKVFHKRHIVKQWSLKDTLETPTTITDHLGNIFNSKKEMCSYWNISPGVFHERYVIKKWSLKDALETPQKCHSDITITDHLGNNFKNITALCTHWNIPYNAFIKRYKKNNSSIKEIIEQLEQYTLSTIDEIKITDHLGNKFNTLSDMCKYWNIPYKTYNYRITHKFTLLESLNIISPITILSKNQTITPDLCLIEHIHENYFLCILNNKQIILSKDQIIQIATDYHKTLHQQKGA